MSSKVMHNKCSGHRAMFEDGKAYRIISFIAPHPSMIAESEWERLVIKGETFIIDKVSAGLMDGHQCELLSVDKDNSKEPTIHAVKLGSSE